ncbi:hypothetical protein NDU88_002722 [Pleurodeles waltl]|uniref:Uncharacterized protein n=1 Tax=Pleurodeles waltl TaxID=8319 RepID=A0AAV7P7S5_PLEWA|nr:hypothetical protein NDU88_002722 [Pleurodeles waltl]
MPNFRPAIWTWAALELQRGMHVAARIPLGGSEGRASTSPAAVEKTLKLLEALGWKFDDLVERMAALEIEVSELKRATENNAEAIQQMKVGEDEVLLKLELTENKMKRNNLRFLKVPEGLEGGDLKSLVVRLIKHGVQIKDEEDLAKECTGTRSENPTIEINLERFWFAYILMLLRSAS